MRKLAHSKLIWRESELSPRRPLVGVGENETAPQL